MKVAVIREPKAPVAFEDRPVPEAGPGQVRLKVAACGVCHSDYHIWEGFFAFAKLPIVPGHEVAGVVDQVGPGVVGWKVGDRAGVPWIWSTCGRCDACVAGDDPGCPEQLATGVQVDGGYAPYLVVPATHATRIPDGLDLVETAPLFCAGLTVYGGLLAAGVEPGMTVAVAGIGGLGHLGVMIASALDTTVIALTRGPEKAAFAGEIGADHVIDTSAGDPGKALRALGGADIVLATAPSAQLMPALLAGLGTRGTLAIVGASGESFPVNPSAMLGRRTRILGSVVGTRTEMRDLLALAVRHDITPVIERYRLDDVPRVFERMERNAIRYRAVIQF